MWEFQAGLANTPEAVGLLAHFGLTVADVGIIAVLGYCLTALIKKHLNLVGWRLLVGSVLSCAIWAVLLYIPQVPKPITATLMAFITSSGGWQSIKDIIGKVQYGGTKPKPLGAGERLIDKNGG